MSTSRQGTIAIPESYRELVALHAPRPIRDAIDFQNTQTILDSLSVRTDLNEDQSDYLELLTQIIETYEAENTKELPSIHGIALLKHLMEEHGMVGDGLAKIIDVDRSTAYKILRKTRKLTIEQIRALAKHFYTSPGAFL